MIDFLSGIRVLDLSQYIPGPFATLMMANYGAEVIKVEPPAGDPMRSFLLRDSDGVSPLYKQLNRGKTRTTIDLKTETGKKVFESLVTNTDVLLESFRPGVMARLGFSAERLAELNPNLIHCALSGFGQTGPYQQRAGHDLTYNAVMGGLGSSGTKEKPVFAFPPIADHAGAMQALSAILAALVGRDRRDKGVFLDVSLSESVLAWQYVGLTSAAAGELVDREMGPLNGGLACYNIYRTKDGRFVALAPLEQKFWINFCRAVQRSDWIDRQFEPLPQEKLINELRDLFESQSLEYWVENLDDLDCCFEAVLNLGEVCEHPQVRARSILKGIEPALAVIADGIAPELGRDLMTGEAEAIANSWAPNASI